LVCVVHIDFWFSFLESGKKMGGKKMGTEFFNRGGAEERRVTQRLARMLVPPMIIVAEIGMLHKLQHAG
jgi:hypothetical protein